ncbi:TonB-dependent receptor [Flexithrix dorotheae]|uniref:TonB-dependent receptor n=1 Tax=Flexithrix dorotheae TaxID=70993 RepID=UPI00036F5F9D|nr:TonB-dependent receptor [Flexithrix dorotheae]
MKLKLLRQILVMSKFALFGIFIQALFCGLLVAKEGKAQKAESIEKIFLSLDLDNVRLIDAFSKIEKATDLNFAYYKTTINKKQRISLNASNESLGNLLRTISKNTDLKFKRVNDNIFVSKKKWQPVKANILADVIEVKQVVIKGTVTSEEDGEPLPGVSIIVKGTTSGTTTDLDGKYTINAPEGSTLVYSYIGFQEYEVAVGNQSTVNVVLKADLEQLEEVVVIGYGSVKKSDLTGSVASVKAEDIENLTINSVQQALAGQAPGVQVGQGSAMPGGGVSIRIRGSNSISSNNEPLYVIDGFPMVSNTGEVPSGSKGNTVSDNPLASLNPSDIESIEVLKDASATAIYGSRGANGVILITTKSGKVGKTNVTFDAYYGMQQVQKLYDVLDAPTFIQAQNERALETGGEIPFPDGEDFYPGMDVNTDWQKEIYRSAPVQNYQLSVTSGTEKSKFALSIGHFDQKGIVKGSGFKRYSIRVNTDTKIGKKFTVGTNMAFSRILNNRVPTEGHNNQNAGPTNTALFTRPTLPIQNPDGTYTSNGTDGSPALQNGEKENPVAQLNEIDNQMTKDNFLGNAYLTYEIIKGLTFKTSVGVNLSNAERNYYATRLTNRGGRGNDGLAIISDAKVSNILNENTLNYNKEFGSKHRINALAGYTIQKQTTARSQMTNTNFPNDITRYDNIGAGTRDGGPQIWSSKNDWRMASYLGRFNYVFNDKYLFTATIRADGSSKFGKENKWATFPSAAVAWRIGQENFMSNMDWLSNMKIRASWGKTGNSEIGSYRSLARFATSSYSYGGTIVSAFYPNQIGNPDLKWETTVQTNLGVDMGFINDRISLSVDLYDKLTEDLLLGVTLPYNTGHNTATMNFGNVTNKGIELALGADIFVNKFKWRTDFNVSHNVNEVTNLGELGTIFGANVSGDFKWNNATMVTEGEPMGVFYGLKTGGVFRDWDDVKTWEKGFMYNAEDEARGAQPGDRKYYDTDGDGKLTVDDREILGTPHPKYIFGFTNNFSYGNFSLNMFIQGATGNKVLNVNRWQLFSNGGSDNIAVERHTGRWTPENPDAEWPRYGNPTPISENIQDWVLEDGDYVRLRNLTISYNIPTAKISWLQKARVYISGDNLLLITKYSGYDPDVNSMQGGGGGNRNYTLGIDNGSYPAARVYKAGFNVTF